MRICWVCRLAYQQVFLSYTPAGYIGYDRYTRYADPEIPGYVGHAILDTWVRPGMDLSKYPGLPGMPGIQHSPIAGFAGYAGYAIPGHAGGAG